MVAHLNWSQSSETTVKKEGSTTVDIKLYTDIGHDFLDTDIKVERDKFYRYLSLYRLLLPNRKNYITTANSRHLFNKYKLYRFSDHYLFQADYWL